MKKTIKHGEVYCCKRYRLMTYLRMRGFVPFKITPEIYNPKFVNWYYTNTPELEAALEEYFSQFNKG